MQGRNCEQEVEWYKRRSSMRTEGETGHTDDFTGRPEEDPRENGLPVTG